MLGSLSLTQPLRQASEFRPLRIRRICIASCEFAVGSLSVWVRFALNHMPSTYSLVRERQEEAALEFGAMLRRWRESNGWTQYTAKKWAQEAGHVSSSHSGLSELERGLTLHPRAQTFLSLAEMNQRIAEEDFKGVHTRELLDQLKGSQPIIGDDGTLWGPAEFWSCHAGLINPPAWLAPPALNSAPLLTPEQAADLCAAWARQARELVLLSGGASTDLVRASGDAPAEQREKWSSVLLGLGSYSPQELQEVWDEAASEWAPAHWLTTWAATLPPVGGGGQVGTLSLSPSGGSGSPYRGSKV